MSYRELVITGGRGLLKLKMGKSIVSSKMGKQKFRVRIAPKDERILADHPRLTVLTEPVRVLRDSPPNRQDQTIVCGVVLETHNWQHGTDALPPHRNGQRTECVCEANARHQEPDCAQGG